MNNYNDYNVIILIIYKHKPFNILLIIKYIQFNNTIFIKMGIVSGKSKNLNLT
jgi:hypothetical protein